jgi:hypothetical protein
VSELSRGRIAGLVATGLALQAVLLVAPQAMPLTFRVALAFVTLVMLPGYAFVALGAMPPGGAWLAPGWAFGLGVAWLGALVLATRALHLPFTVLAGASLVTSALLWLAVLARRGPTGAAAPSRDRPVRPQRVPLTEDLNGLALIALLLAVAVAAIHCARLGAPLGLHTDSPDHIGTIRRMLASGDAFPRDAFFKDAGAGGADPRKGLWHAEVALVARLADADPLDTWRLLPILLAPLFVLNVAVFGFLLRGPPGAAIAGWALVLTYGGSLAEQFLREAVFATKVGDQLALACAAAVLADLRTPERRLRLAAVGLALGALAAHVYYAIQFAMVFAALGVGLLIADRGWSGRLARLTGTSLAVAVAGLPYLVWRASQSYAPTNVIHTEPQGLMTLFGEARIVSPGVLWDWLGSWWILFPLAAPWLWRAGRRDPAVLYLLTTPLIVALVIFDPPVVAFLQPRLGYLLMRMVWMMPLAALFGWMLPGLVSAMRGGTVRARLAPALALAAIAWLSWPALRDAADVLAHPRRYAAHEAEQTAARWDDALAWMKAHLPPGTVVLSDPATSYSIPMATGLYVATLVDQHSSPNDSLALTRILDARDALDPWSPWDRVRQVLSRYRVDAIALNDRFVSPPPLDYWTPRHDGYAAARARFDAAPAAFEPAYDHDGFVVYRIRRPALDTLSTPPLARAMVTPLADAAAAREGDTGTPALMGFAQDRRSAAPGDTLHMVITWRGGTRPAPPASWQVAVRFDTPVPGMHAPRWAAKPVRKLIERSRHERYRFRADHLPAGGAYGVDLWRADEAVRDSFVVVVPEDAAPGRYDVSVRLLRQPHYPNYRLSDYFFEDDYYAGARVSTLDVRRGPAMAGGS